MISINYRYLYLIQYLQKVGTDFRKDTNIIINTHSIVVTKSIALTPAVPLRDVYAIGIACDLAEDGQHKKCDNEKANVSLCFFFPH